MEDFRLSERFMRELKHRAITGLAVVTAVVIGAVALIQTGWRIPRSVEAFVPIIALGLVLTALVGLRSLRRIQTRWTFRIVVTEAGISREQYGLPDVVLRADEIASLSEVPGTGLVVQGDSEGELIEIPEGLEDYERCRELLGRWRQIERPTPRSQLTALFRYLVGVGFLGSLTGLFSSSAPEVVAPLGAVLIASATFLTVSPRKRPATKPRARDELWLIAIVVMLVLLRVAEALGRLGP